MEGSKHKIGSSVLTISIGIVYLWFGALKFFPQLSPAEDLAINTIDIMDFGLIPSEVSIILLAIWETCIGLMLIFNLFRQWALGFSIVHIALTFTPIIFFPKEIFNNGPFGLTLLGQYIIKNIIILSILVSLFMENKGATGAVSNKALRSDNNTGKRTVQYSWQAQRVASGYMEITNNKKMELAEESKF